MYGVAGESLGRADHLPIVQAIGAGELWIALGVWAVAFAAMLHHPRSHPAAGPGRRCTMTFVQDGWSGAPASSAA